MGHPVDKTEKFASTELDIVTVAEFNKYIVDIANMCRPEKLEAGNYFRPFFVFGPIGDFQGKYQGKEATRAENTLL